MSPSVTACYLGLMAYFIGSFNSAIVLCRLFGLPDPRTQGSKNPGATNVLRIAGKGMAANVFIIDALKGFIPVFAFSFLTLPAFGISFIGLCASGS